jgi:prepilin-type N-terminal cleavage/methylation domain-containing protein
MMNHHTIFMGSRHTRFHKKKGFTLVELMVSLIILALLSGIIFQIISSSSKLTLASTNKQDSLEQARLVLDRLGMDLSSSIHRDDLPYEYKKNAGNDALLFYAYVSGYGSAATPTRQVSLLSYRVKTVSTTTSSSPQLQRSALGTSWQEGPDLSFSSAIPSNPLDEDYQVLAENVFRFEICFLQKPTIGPSLPSPAQLVAAPPLLKSDMGAIVITIALIDAKSAQILNGTQLDEIAANFQDAEDGQTAGELWNQALKSSSFAPTLPRAALQGVRIMERYYEVP